MAAKKKPAKKSSQKGKSWLAGEASGGQARVRVIAVKTLREFWKKHTDAEQPLKAWHKEVRQSSWQVPGDIKLRYPSADLLPGNRVVFNIKGNTYRLVVKVHYNNSIVYIRFLGTHAEYDRIDATTI